MAKISGGLIVIMVACLFSAQTVQACSCSRLGPSTCSASKNDGLVFVGTVIGIENPPDEKAGAFQGGESRYRFRVDENINGVESSEVDVFSGRGGADCSYHFQLGQTYLVDPGEDKGRLFATICSDTQPVADAEALLSELRARRDGQRHASIFGALRRTQQPYKWTSYDDYDRPLPNVTVELHSENHTLSAQTDRNGIYRFYEVPADTYHFSAVLPEGLELAQAILSDPLPPITVPDRACYQQDIDALPTGRIRGRVVGPDGVPLKNADVALFRADRYKEYDMGWWEFQDEEKGHFEFEHVTPGKYLIVFHNSNRSDPDIPFPRTFYPASSDFQTALPITVGEGEQILDADIHVSGGPPTRQLVVHVRWAEDSTPDDVEVKIRPSEGDIPLPQELSPGVYQVAIFRDARYTIFAIQSCGHRWVGDTAFPIGFRETGQVNVGGSDTRTTEITVSLTDPTCRPYSELEK